MTLPRFRARITPVKPPGSYRACLIDALGTTVRLDPPWEHVDPALVAGLPAERVRDAFRAEMSYYADHAQEGSDAASLAALREQCAELLSAGLGRPVGVGELMASIRFEAYSDARPALAALRAGGLRVVCVSNWDFELAGVLDRIGLAAELDDVVVSALAGARKPDPAIFAAALAAAGCEAHEAIHVGDGPADVDGARAAGIDVLRIDRDGNGDLATLAELPPLLLPAAAISEH
jgi:FMN phosphatase YigB (HAD superfamily)